MIFTAWNGPSPTTAGQAKVTTGTAIKTLLQLSTPSTRQITVLAWGISFDGTVAATPGICELIQTDVAATVTAHVAAGLVSADGVAASSLTLGTANTGYTGSAEGTITATRVFDAQLIMPTSQYIYQFMPDERPVIPVSKFLRVRVTFGTAINSLTWIRWSE